MIYFFLDTIEDKHSPTLYKQLLLIEFIKDEIKSNYEYKILKPKSKINDLDFSSENDIFIFEPMIANKNLDILRKYPNSIVVLEKPTILIQKISKFNPINENIAINNNFKLLYLSDEVDPTNNEFKIILNENEFIITKKQLFDLI